MGDRGRILHGDARALDTFADCAPFDAIVTNPPFGRRLGQHIDFRRFYRDLLDGAREVIAEDGRLVLLADRRGLFNSACRDSGRWHIRDVRIVELGGIHPGVFVLTPT
jgi:tRNA (guanine6-N2)-methyltransferase